MSQLHSIKGSVTREGDWTTFSLQGRNRDGFMAGQRCQVETKRLLDDPALFKNTLDRMARDLPRYDLV